MDLHVVDAYHVGKHTLIAELAISRVDPNSEEPRPAVRARLELMEVAPR
jgi:hypothetical protein